MEYKCGLCGKETTHLGNPRSVPAGWKHRTFGPIYVLLCDKCNGSERCPSDIYPTLKERVEQRFGIELPRT